MDKSLACSESATLLLGAPQQLQLLTLPQKEHGQLDI